MTGALPVAEQFVVVGSRTDVQGWISCFTCDESQLYIDIWPHSELFRPPLYLVLPWYFLHTFLRTFSLAWERLPSFNTCLLDLFRIFHSIALYSEVFWDIASENAPFTTKQLNYRQFGNQHYQQFGKVNWNGRLK
jgi:hypothetical protein